MPEVRLLGGRLRGLLDGSRVQVEARKVQQLLDVLVERGGDELAAIFYEDPAAAPRQPHRDLRVLVNGRSMRFLEGLDTPLGEDDTVTVFMAGARGWPGG